MTDSVFIIAEAGVNHNGDPSLAYQLIDAAIAAGADAVKFQTFRAEKIVTESAVKARYQKRGDDVDERQISMLRRLELSYDTYRDLLLYCKNRGIEFMSTAFDMESLEFLLNDLGLRKLKLPSGEITNGPFLLAHAKVGCDLIMSTGMSTLGEVEEALGVIAFGLTDGKSPSRERFRAAYSSETGQQALRDKVILLHCTTEYPAPADDINLRAMDTLCGSFGLNVGLSDHSQGIAVPIAAVARGACVIEKHFTLDKTLAGPDHAASLDPIEMKMMVGSIRKIELALGNCVKVPSPSELENRDVARKSLVAARKIKAGDLFSKDNLVAKRPGTGVSPMEYWSRLGNKSDRYYDVDDLIG